MDTCELLSAKILVMSEQAQGNGGAGERGGASKVEDGGCKDRDCGEDGHFMAWGPQLQTRYRLPRAEFYRLSLRSRSYQLQSEEDMVLHRCSPHVETGRLSEH